MPKISRVSCETRLPKILLPVLFFLTRSDRLFAGGDLILQEQPQQRFSQSAALAIAAHGDIRHDAHVLIADDLHDLQDRIGIRT